MEFVLTHPALGLKEILVIFDGVPYEADSDHPWWNEIIRLCLEDDPRVLDLFPVRVVQQPSAEIDPALVALQAEIEDPPFTTRAGGLLRPENRILVDHFKRNDYSLRRMVEAEGYSLDDLHEWMDADSTLYPELRAAIDERRQQVAFGPRWLPHNIDREDDEDDDEAEARAEAREGEHTAHEIIEEGS